MKIYLALIGLAHL